MRPVIATIPNKTKRCGICCEKGHHQYICRKIKALPKKNDAARNTLAKLLVLVDPMCDSPLMIRHFNDKD